MEKKVIENLELIATRVPPGDRWRLTSDINIIYNSLTDVLEAYYNITKFKGSYRLVPLESNLFAIKIIEEEIKPEPPKKFNIYGDPI